MNIPHRAQIRVAKFNAHCWADDALYCTVNETDENKPEIMIDLFRCNVDGLQARLTLHNPNGLSPSLHIHLTTADVLGVAEFLLRRMLQLDALPVRALFRRFSSFLKGENSNGEEYKRTDTH